MLTKLYDFATYSRCISIYLWCVSLHWNHRPKQHPHRLFSPSHRYHHLSWALIFIPVQVCHQRFFAITISHFVSMMLPATSSSVEEGTHLITRHRPPFRFLTSTPFHSSVSSLGVISSCLLCYLLSSLIVSPILPAVCTRRRVFGQDGQRRAFPEEAAWSLTPPP